MHPLVLCVSVLLVSLHLPSALSSNSFQFSFSPKATPSHCFKSITRCFPLNTSQCLDVTLPYKFTHPPAMVDVSGIDEKEDADQQVLSQFSSIHSYLAQWNGLRVIPQCWKALQSVLCASFFPRCDGDDQRLSLPTAEMCRLIRGPCRLVDQHFHWPDFLRCDNQSLFPAKCPNEYTDLRFAIQPAAARCQHPLVSTDDSHIWYPGIDGCALRCDRDPFYSEAQQLQISRLIAYGSISAILMTAFGCATYAINWKRSNKFPPVCVFWLNASLLVASLGWTPQLFKGRTEMVCRADNTTRYGESSIDSSCVVSFFLIYFGTMSALFWYTICAYSCYYSYQGTETRRHRLNEKSAMFYMISILVPFVLTILNVVVGEIDAEPVYGICFVGLVNTKWRIAMVFVPFGVCVLLGTFWNTRSIRSLTLINRSMRKQKAAAGVSERSVARKCAKTKTVIIRLGYTQVYVIIAFVGIAIITIFQQRITEQYRRQLDSFIICNLNISNALQAKSPEAIEHLALEENDLDLQYPLMREYSSRCHRLLPRPDLLPIYLQFALYFLASVTSSSWLFTRSTADIWRRFFREGFTTTSRHRGRAKSKHGKVAQTRNTNEEYAVRNPASGTTAGWQNNTGADQSSLGFLDRTELAAAATHAGIRCSSRRRYHDPAEMDINSVTTATSQNSWSTALKESFQTFINRRSIQLLNKSTVAPANSSRAFPQSAFPNTSTTHPKPIEPSSVSQVINFHNNEHSQSDSMVSQIPMDSTQHSTTCTEPVGATGVTEENNRNPRRKTKKERKAMLHSLVRRRGSDTSGSVICAARSKVQQQKKTTTTTSTSTGDLPGAVQDQMSQSAAPPVPHPGAALPPQQHLPPMAFRPPMPGIQPPQFPSPAQTAFNRPPFFIGSPTFPQPMRPRPVRPVGTHLDNGFTFTHGMSDQASNLLVNPLEQVRRPESSMNLSVGSASKATNRSPTIQQSNFALQTLSANQSMMMTPHQSAAAAAQPFAFGHQRFPMMYPQPGMPYAAPAAYGPSTGMIPNAALVTPQGSYYNTAAAAAVTYMQQQQQMSYADLQALMKEREAYLSLVTPMRSDSVASSVSKFFPIALSDSEGMFSDAGSIVGTPSHSRPSGFKEIKKDLRQKAEELKGEIEGRFKQVEQQQQQQQENNDEPAPNNDATSDPPPAPISSDAEKEDPN